MLKRITLKNFRQHVDRTFDLTRGLNVIRGANEKGKSTILEGVAYAFFGAKACRQPLAQVVTWGKNERDLAVELVFQPADVEYTITRSPRGAEVNYDGGRVVGQAEVTAFVQRLLGADSQAAGKLMLAPQGAIRGALDEGATKTMKLIEELADFDLIDRLIELLQEHYVTGPTTTAEARLADAEANLKAAREQAVAPDTASLEAKISTLAAGISVYQKKADELRPLYEAAEKAVQEAEVGLRTRAALQTQLEAVRRAKEERQKQLGDATVSANAGPAPGAVEAARSSLQQALEADRLKGIYAQFHALAYPETFWEGDQASFETEVQQLQAKRQTAAQLHQAAQKGSAAAKAEIRVLEAQRITGSACGFCGKDVSAVPEVVAKNKAIDEQIKVQQGLLATAEKAVKENERVATEAADALVEMEVVRKSAQPILAFLARYPDYVTADNSTFPPRLTWSGPAVAGGVSVADLKSELARLEAAERKAQLAAARVQALKEAIEQDDAAIARLSGEIAACLDEAELEKRRVSFRSVSVEYNEAAGKVAEYRYEKGQLEAQIESLKKAYELAKQAVAAAERSVATAKAELEQLEFNNALLKKIRSARPVIADKLWNIVLAAVSTYFSSMRGTKSVVTREGNTFLVDGKPIEGLSGSTLDILGLAIRLALTKTFLPTAPFLILDEPAAAMDENRTQMMLGFLVAAGFSQTLLVTHEEQSEAVADNLITI